MLTFSHYITEVFAAPYPYKMASSGKGNIHYSFKTDAGNELLVDFERGSSKDVRQRTKKWYPNLMKVVDGELKITPTKDFDNHFRVMSTLKAIIDEMLAREDCSEIIFVGTTNKLSRVYHKMVVNVLKKEMSKRSDVTTVTKEDGTIKIKKVTKSG